MNAIITSEEYNRRGYQEYRKAVDKWKQEDHPKTYPFLGFYIFEKLNGEPRNYGYVLTTEHGGKWFRTKQEVINERKES